MPGALTYAVQVYKRKGGRIVRDRRIPVPNGDEAVQTAAAMIPTVPFAAALRLTVDAEGVVWSTDVIGSFGETPDDLAESLVEDVMRR